jgi:hypothetical protein
MPWLCEPPGICCLKISVSTDLRTGRHVTFRQDKDRAFKRACRKKHSVGFFAPDRCGLEIIDNDYLFSHECLGIICAPYARDDLLDSIPRILKSSKETKV